MWGSEEQGKKGEFEAEESTYLSSLTRSVWPDYLHEGVLSLSLCRNP